MIKVRSADSEIAMFGSDLIMIRIWLTYSRIVLLGWNPIKRWEVVWVVFEGSWKEDSRTSNTIKLLNCLKVNKSIDWIHSLKIKNN